MAASIDERTAEEAAEAAPRRGRPRAGHDPVKRRQIIDGARRVFINMGFDAASMKDITREAGVSKGTLYVYFENKERLFAAIVDEERSSHVERIFEFDYNSPDVESVSSTERAVAGVSGVQSASTSSLALGVVYLVCEPTGAAATNPGRWAYGLLAGMLIVILGEAGRGIGSTAAVVFAALLGSVFAPLIDRIVIRINVNRRRRRQWPT